MSFLMNYFLATFGTIIFIETSKRIKWSVKVLNLILMIVEQMFYKQFNLVSDLDSGKLQFNTDFSVNFKPIITQQQKRFKFYFHFTLLFSVHYFFTLLFIT